MRNIIISRTDNLGDVVLSLPVAGKLKQVYPNAKIIFLGKAYTEPIISSSIFIDEFWDKEKLTQYNASEIDAIVFLFPDIEVAKWAKKNQIKFRIGTSHRWWHWLYCNKLINFSRKKSNLHEAQLNFKLLQPFGIKSEIALKEIPALYGMKSSDDFPDFLKNIFQKDKTKVILHTKSKGSAREWPIENYFHLAQQLSPEDYQIFITGTEAEGDLIKKQQSDIFNLPNVTDLTGKLSLKELINFIGEADILVACSTGPLHIAAALNKLAIGIFPNIKPMHPQRWKPLGKHVEVVHIDKENCRECVNDANKCNCIKSVSVSQIKDIISKSKLFINY